MRKSKNSESQIVAILAEGDAGLAVAEICLKHRISNALYYQWKSKYASVSVNEQKRIRELRGDRVSLKEFLLSGPRLSDDHVDVIMQRSQDAVREIKF